MVLLSQETMIPLNTCASKCKMQANNLRQIPCTKANMLQSATLAQALAALRCMGSPDAKRGSHLGVMRPLVRGALDHGLAVGGVERDGLAPCLAPGGAVRTAARLLGAHLAHARPVTGLPPALLPLQLQGQMALELR